MESELKQLRDLGPLIDFKVTATLLRCMLAIRVFYAVARSIYLICRCQGRAHHIFAEDIFYTDASSKNNYVGTLLPWWIRRRATNCILQPMNSTKEIATFLQR